MARRDVALGVLTVVDPSRFPELVFADEFAEVFKEADEDDDQGAGEPDEEEPGEQVHDGAGESDHSGILTQACAAERVSGMEALFCGGRGAAIWIRLRTGESQAGKIAW